MQMIALFAGPHDRAARRRRRAVDDHRAVARGDRLHVDLARVADVALFEDAARRRDGAREQRLHLRHARASSFEAPLLLRVALGVELGE